MHMVLGLRYTNLAASGPLGLMARPLRMRSRSLGMSCRLALQRTHYPRFSFDPLSSVPGIAHATQPSA